MEKLFESITFDGFCTLLKRYKRTYENIARSINCVERTLRRYRKGEEPYISLSEDKYDGLFKCLEKECKSSGEDIIQVIVDFFGLPIDYLKKEYSELKSVIIYNLDYGIRSKVDELPFGSKNLLQECFQNKEAIESIRMAFHSGWEFWEDRKMRNLLKVLNNSGIIIQIIANPDSAVRQIAMAMRDPHLIDEYIGFNETLSKWAERANMLDNLYFRVSEYPILRKIYIVKYKDGSKKALFRDYVYGYAPDVNTAFIQLSDNDPSLTIFEREFDFHWQKSKTYPDWILNLPKQEEIMPSKNYILLYLSHQKNNCNNNPLSEFVVSSLSIEEDNNITLYANVSENNAIYTNSEYTYHGKLKLTRNNIFMSLCDQTDQEHISILFSRPLYDKERFLGIMTALSPNGQPVAFKCVCVSQSILQRLDIQQLKQILSNNNQKWNNTLMILEEKDINNFYSNRILE